MLGGALQQFRCARTDTDRQQLFGRRHPHRYAAVATTAALGTVSEGSQALNLVHDGFSANSKVSRSSAIRPNRAPEAEKLYRQSTAGNNPYGPHIMPWWICESQVDADIHREAVFRQAPNPGLPRNLREQSEIWELEQLLKNADRCESPSGATGPISRSQRRSDTDQARRGACRDACANSSVQDVLSNSPVARSEPSASAEGARSGQFFGPPFLRKKGGSGGRRTHETALDRSSL